MDDLTLLTWNVRYFGHGLKGLRATRGGMHRIAAAIADDPPDLIALQEVETRSLRGGLDPRPQLQRFADALHTAAEARGHDRRWTPIYFPAHRYALRRGPALYTTGLAVLVSDALDVVGHNATAPEPITHFRLKRFSQVKQQRIAAHVRVRDPSSGTELDLFNTHLSLPAFLEVGTRMPHLMGAGTNQLAEVRALLDFMDRTRGDHAVVVGDFNSSPGSPVYQALADAGLHDGFAEAVDHDREVMDRWSTVRFFHHRMHIDHVFSTPRVHWLEWQPWTACRGGPFHGLSDHAPKVGRLRIDRAA